MALSDAERIAKLEAEMAHSLRERDEISEQLKVLIQDVSTIKGQFQRYQGFLGGVIFVVTAISGAIGAIGMTVWQRIFPSG